ncbi:NUDIX hydrolase [Halosimplex sp. J119]
MLDERHLSMVAIEPSYCHQCGAELGTRQIDGRARRSCPECGHLHFRDAVPSVDTIVRRGTEVLLIDPPGDGAWQLPGGHPEFDEEPSRAAVRELEEETGLAASESDLELLSVVHSALGEVHYNMITYTLDVSATDGSPAPGEEASEVAFWSTDRILSSPEQTRQIDRRVLRKALDRV